MEEDDATDDFFMCLREKAAKCEYVPLKDELIQDKIDFGITNEGTCHHLLREHDLILNTAIETCCTLERTDL